MPERLTYRIDHPDGTQTFIGATTRSFGAFRNPYQLITEEEISAKLAEINLPFRATPEKNVGWGGFSVAVRLEDTGRNYVAVLRDLPTGGVNDLARLWQMEKDINIKFKPYTIPQQIVITDGIEHNPMTIKLSPEVRGGTLKDLSALYLLGNPAFLRQYIDFSRRVLKEFRDTGTLIDTSGHISESPLRQIYLGLTPFNSSNLMLEEGIDKLQFIDCDIKPRIHMLSEAKPLQKAGLLLRAVVLGSSIPLATTMLAVHHIRDRLFGENPSTENDPQFAEGFAEIIKILENFGADYRVLGSFAIAATIQQSGEDFHLSPRRRNRTRRDVDIILLNPQSIDLIELEKILTKIKNKYKESPIPSLSISLQIEESKNRKGRVSKMGMDVMGNYYMIYEGIYIPVPRELLEPVDLWYQGVRFKTLEPGVIAGFALTRGGAIKFKDRDKVAKMLKLTGGQIPNVFIDLAKEIRRKYPSKYKNFLIREWLTYLTGGFVGGGQLSELSRKLSELVSVNKQDLDTRPLKERVV